MSEIDTTQLLPMADVLGGKDLEPSVEILYSDYIDKEKVVSAFNSLVELGAEGGICQTTEELITTNDALMSKTGSSQFYTGTNAQQQFARMSEIGGQFNSIRSYVNSSDELSLMESCIKTYNDKLTKLKANCRRKLLQNYADKFNEEKHEYEGYPVTKNYKYTNDDFGFKPTEPYNDSEFNYCSDSNEAKFDVVRISYDKQDIIKQDEYGYSYVAGSKFNATYRIHCYKFIKHWNFFKAWDTFFDPGFKEIEQLFKKVGAELPYDPALIVGPDAES